MSQPTPPPTTPMHEPGLGTVEMLCERLGELGLPIGPDTAREILRAVLAAESSRMEAHVREALQTSLDTIRVAAQAALGVLTSTTPVQTRPASSSPPKPVLDPAPKRATPAAMPRPSPGPSSSPSPSRRPVAKRNSESDSPDDLDGEKRPVFRRPRGR